MYLIYNSIYLKRNRYIGQRKKYCPVLQRRNLRFFLQKKQLFEFEFKNNNRRFVICNALSPHALSEQ